MADDGLDIPDFLRRTETEAERKRREASIRRAARGERKIKNPPKKASRKSKGLGLSFAAARRVRQS